MDKFDAPHNKLGITLTADEHGPHEVVKPTEFIIERNTTMHLTDPPFGGATYAHEMRYTFNGHAENLLGFGETEAEAVAEALRLMAESVIAHG